MFFFLKSNCVETFLRGEDKQSHENQKNRRKCNKENVLQSYYDDEKSGSENPASWENAGAENTLCVGNVENPHAHTTTITEQLKLATPPAVNHAIYTL